MAQDKAPKKISCEDVIGECDKALNRKEVVLQTYKTAIEQSIKENANLHTQVDKLEDSNKAWYHNPIVMSVLGIAAGVVISKTVLFK